MKYNKIIFVCDYGAKYGGNFIASFNYLANKLIRRNIEVYFIFPEVAKKQKWEIDLSKFNVLYCDFDKQNLVNTIGRCLTRNDHVIIHFNFISSLFILRLKGKLGNCADYVFHQHMAVKFGLKQLVKGIILRLFAPKKIAYIGVSQDVFNDVRKEVGKKKSRLVLNAIDTKRLKTINNFDNHNILIFGTDYYYKGVDLAIRAIQHSEIENKCKLLIVTHNVSEARQMILREFGVLPVFVKIIPPVQDIGKLYSNSFLFLSPSRSEAFGYSVVEAAYSGNQVIISNVPGQNMLSEIPGVEEVQLENTKQLREKIIYAFEHSNDNRNKINNEACKYIADHFSLEKWSNSILEIYNSFS